MADTLKTEFDLEAVSLIAGNRGEFSLWLGDTLLAQKSYAGFPTVDDAIQAMRAALKPAD